MHTITELMTAAPRTQRLLKSPKHQPSHNATVAASQVPAMGEVVRLGTNGLTRVSGLYRDGRAYINPAHPGN